MGHRFGCGCPLRLRDDATASAAVKFCNASAAASRSAAGSCRSALTTFSTFLRLKKSSSADFEMNRGFLISVVVVDVVVFAAAVSPPVGVTTHMSNGARRMPKVDTTSARSGRSSATRGGVREDPADVALICRLKGVEGAESLLLRRAERFDDDDSEAARPLLRFPCRRAVSGE